MNAGIYRPIGITIDTRSMILGMCAGVIADTAIKPSDDNISFS